MADEHFDGAASETSQPDSADLKKKVASQSTQAGGQMPEDQSRGVLHYGESHVAETSDEPSHETPQGDTNESSHPAVVSDGDAPNQDRASATSQSDLGQQFKAESADNTDDIQFSPDQNSPPEPPSAEQKPQDGRQGSVDAGKHEDTNATAANPETDGEFEPQPSQNTSSSTTAEPTFANAAPTAVTLSSNSISENSAGAVVGTLSVTDPNHGDSHSFSLSDDRFEVVDGHVKLKDGVSLDHENTAELKLEVTVTDSGGATLTESFEISVKDVNEAPSGLALSNHAIAENTEGAVIGRLSVSDQDLGDSHSFHLSDDRFEVVDGHVKLKDGVSLDHENTAELTLEVAVTDSGGASYTDSFDITVAEVPDLALSTGFHAKYFDMNQRIESIDDVDWNSDATHQELVNDINYKNSSQSFWEGGSKDTFGVQITGNIEVEEGGVFNFHIGGDDGVVLYMNGKEVVDNDGLHGFRTRSGEVELDPGTHVIEVRYFENYGHAGLKVEWEGPGIDGRELLSPPDLGDLQTVNGMPIALNLETGMTTTPEGELTQMIEGLPPGTTIQAEEMSVEVDETGAADISGWDTSLLMVTPPVEFTGKVDAQVSTHVTLENGDRATSTIDISFDVNQADISPPEIEMQAGFRASYFDVDHTLRQLDDVDWDADPTKEEVIGEIDYANGRESFWEGGSKDTFGVRITGEITVDEAGSFEFFLGGDDGVVLYIDGIEVIDNDRLHAYRTKSGEIELEAGTHEIEVRYFENYGHAGLKLEWEGPGTGGRELVHADTELSVPENGALDISLGSADIGPDGSVIVSGLPADTILISGNNSAVSDGSDIDLSGWDLDLIELMPPNGFEGTISAEIMVTDMAYNGELIETSEVFEIEVGDTQSEPSSDASRDDMLLVDSTEQNDGDRGWVEEASNSDERDENEGDDDVMEEPVEGSRWAEESAEPTETYERSDW